MKLDSAVFYSNNIDRVIRFYQDIIDLKLDYIQTDKYVSFWFENKVRLGIKKTTKNKENPGFQTIFISTEDAKSLFAKLKEKNVRFEKELVEQSWGTEFTILDPDDNRIVFIQRVK